MIISMLDNCPTSLCRSKKRSNTTIIIPTLSRRWRKPQKCSPIPQTQSPTPWRHSTHRMPGATCFSQPLSRAGSFSALASSYVEAKFRAPPHNQFHDAGEPWNSACKSRLLFPAHSHNPPPLPRPGRSWGNKVYVDQALL